MKTEITETELRELNAWIEKQIFGRADVTWGDFDGGIEWDADKPYPRNFTANPAASDALDDKILEKCGKLGYQYWWNKGCWMQYEGMRVFHPDKKICRVLFAQKLFSK